MPASPAPFTPIGLLAAGYSLTHDTPLGNLYSEFGRRIHHDKDRDFDIADALTAVGLDTSHAAAADDAWDGPIRERHAVGIDLAGDDIGTPIIVAR